MIQSITVTNHVGQSINLSMRSPELSGLFIKSIDGLGPTPGNISLTEIPTVDGAYFNNARQTARNIVFTLGFMNLTAQSVESLRYKVYQYFPTKRPIVIQINTDIRTVWTLGYVETVSPKIFSNSTDVVISVLCPDAHFYSTTPVQSTFYGVEPLFEFPFSNESLVAPLLEFSEMIGSLTKTVNYAGEEPVGLQLDIWFNGSISDLVITNTTYNQVMTIDDTILGGIIAGGFSDGDHLTIITKKGSKSITVTRGSTTYNILNAYDSSVANSAWFTLEPGDNLYSVSATGSLTTSFIEISHEIKYAGV